MKLLNILRLPFIIVTLLCAGFPYAVFSFSPEQAQQTLTALEDAYKHININKSKKVSLKLLLPPKGFELLGASMLIGHLIYNSPKSTQDFPTFIEIRLTRVGQPDLTVKAIKATMISHYENKCQEVGTPSKEKDMNAKLAVFEETVSDKDGYKLLELGMTCSNKHENYVYYMRFYIGPDGVASFDYLKGNKENEDSKKVINEMHKDIDSIVQIVNE